MQHGTIGINIKKVATLMFHRVQLSKFQSKYKNHLIGDSFQSIELLNYKGF